MRFWNLFRFDTIHDDTTFQNPNESSYSELLVKSRYCETSSFFLMNSLRCFVIMDQSQTVALRIGDSTPILAKFSSLSGNFEICELDSTIKLSRTFRTYNPSVILRLQGPITDHKNVCLLSSPNKRMIPQFVGTVRRWFVIPLDMTIKRYNTINGRWTNWAK